MAAKKKMTKGTKTSIKSPKKGAPRLGKKAGAKKSAKKNAAKE